MFANQPPPLHLRGVPKELVGVQDHWKCQLKVWGIYINFFFCFPHICAPGHFAQSMGLSGTGGKNHFQKFWFFGTWPKFRKNSDFSLRLKFSRSAEKSVFFAVLPSLLVRLATGNSWEVCETWKTWEMRHMCIGYFVLFMLLHETISRVSNHLMVEAVLIMYETKGFSHVIRDKI